MQLLMVDSNSHYLLLHEQQIVKRPGPWTDSRGRSSFLGKWWREVKERKKRASCSTRVIQILKYLDIVTYILYTELTELFSGFWWTLSCVISLVAPVTKWEATNESAIIMVISLVSKSDYLHRCVFTKNRFSISLLYIIYT